MYDCWAYAHMNTPDAMLPVLLRSALHVSIKAGSIQSRYKMDQPSRSFHLIRTVVDVGMADWEGRHDQGV
jgi:hypothetical protein